MTTDVEGNYKSAVNKGFMRLFYYIGGNNEAGIKIPMTAPVAVVVHPSTIDGNLKNISVSFFVPAKSIPPKPKDLTIHELNLTGSTVYVRSFGGFALESDWTDNAQALEADLKAAGISYDPVSYVAAGYDSPFRLFNRHNEVWFHGLKMENAEKPENA
ncbi:HEBP2 protein, partial [Atractosteus spatula]|nr:HEBP2 protein [Atractosteus spatula]